MVGIITEAFPDSPFTCGQDGVVEKDILIMINEPFRVPPLNLVNADALTDLAVFSHDNNKSGSQAVDETKTPLSSKTRVAVAPKVNT